jgi:hypothetical protein
MTPNEPNYINPNLKECDYCGLQKIVETELDYHICRDCINDIDREMANMTVLQHLIEIPICIFHFRFSSALGSLVLAIQRAFAIGMYDPIEGEFYTRKLIDKPKPKD